LSAVISVLVVAPSAWAAPSTTLSPTVGPPSTSVKVTGAGFDPSTSLDVFVDATDVVVATSNASGAVSITITMPAGAQPGTHWITLDEGRTHPAAQAPFTVRTDWPQQGFGAQGRRYNAYENTIGTDNVSALTRAWARPVSGFTSPTPFIVYTSYAFVGDVDGAAYAFSQNGTLLWTASPGTDLHSAAPAAYNSRVFFGGANGTVYAYLTTCRTDGGTCTPAWSTSVGTAVTGPLSIYNGLVYVPSSDGTVHALNPSTGAPGTALTLFGGSGAATAGVAFAPDGSYYTGRGSTFNFKLPCCSGGNTYAGAVSSSAAYNGAAYFTTSDGFLREFTGANWTATISGSGCAAAPAVANNVVYAESCGTLGAFDAGTGTVVWSKAMQVANGVVMANNVLYACTGTTAFPGLVVAFDAATGTRLWTGGPCSTQPIVANGKLYVAGNSLLDVYDLTSARTARLAHPAGHRPDPAKLRFDPRLHRHHKRGHHKRGHHKR
jgi:outer membrane protein assembly factor BamB